MKGIVCCAGYVFTENTNRSMVSGSRPVHEEDAREIPGWVKGLQWLHREGTMGRYGGHNRLIV